MNKECRKDGGWQWPDDYVALDHGALRVRPDCVDAFQQYGWTALDTVMNSDQVRVVRTRNARDNCIVNIDTDNGPVRGYLKRHRVRTPEDWRRERGVRRAADNPGMAEADAVRWCAAASVPTVNVIAAGFRRSLQNPRQSDSFFLSEDLSGCVPACELWHDDGFTTEARERAIVGIAAVTQRLHAAQLFHYDLYLDHFFVSRDDLAVPGSRVTAYLIDLQRVERLESPFAAWRAEVKDLGQFYGSCQHHGVSNRERELWARHYFGSSTAPAVSGTESLTLTAAIARWEVRQLRRHVISQIQRAGTLFS